jgi:hypothetical protein
VIRSVTANIGKFGSIVTAFVHFFKGRMFSRWIVTNVTSACGTVHCRKTRIPLRGSVRDLWTVLVFSPVYLCHLCCKDVGGK